MSNNVSRLQINTQRFRRKIQMQLGKYPWFFFISYRLLGKKRELAVNKDTHIVIEGFPRSGNTFAVCAFEFSQIYPVKIAHHLHVPAQVIRAAQYRVPCIVIIRNPIDAIVSLVIRQICTPIDTALDEYISFYEHILPFREYFALEKFENIISDFGKVIEKVNKNFRTEFLIFKHSRENVQNIFEMIENLAFIEHKSRIDLAKVALPSDFRKPLKNKFLTEIKLPQYAIKLERAKNIYQSLIKTF